MEDKVQKLLQPRYEVIADYPSSHNDVGEIISFTDKTYEAYYSQYPHLFRKLSWWEKREESEMPEYLKSAEDKNLCKVVEHFCGLNKQEVWCYFPELNAHHYVRYEHIEPATETDYLTFINKKKV